MKILAFIVAGILLPGCKNKMILITHEYIVNENWTESVNAIEISKMRLKKDSAINIGNLNQVDVVKSLEVDSSFIYSANVNINLDEEVIGRKVYFGKDNGFFWWTHGGNMKTAILGNLEKNQWYKFSHLLTHPYDVYIFVDSSYVVHRQDVIRSNY